ncbi:hypothetical protein PV327_009967 [Microctonus hyperodae]|nr:hypothetical protein PV327_009967 [Microctonus hyperodae]
MSVKTTYSKSYKKIETPVVKTKAILPSSVAEWFQGSREFNEKSCYADAYIPQSTEPRKSIPFVPSGNIHLSDKKMSSDTTNRVNKNNFLNKSKINEKHVYKLNFNYGLQLSYQSVYAEKRIPFRPKRRNMLGDGSMESTTTNRSDFQFKTTERPEIIIPCDNIRNSNTPIEGSTTTRSSYMNHGVVQPPPSFKPSVSYSRSSSKLDGDTINRLSYPRWTPPAKEIHPWAKKIEYQRPKERMVGDSMYNMSFAPPGYYIEVRNTVDSSDATQNSDSIIIDACANDNSPTCATKVCNDNERCVDTVDNYTPFCACLPKYYRNEITTKCELKYQWVEYTPVMFNDARLIHSSSSFGVYYVLVRLIQNNGDKVPDQGKIDIYHVNKTLAFFPQTIIADYKRLEVLLVEHGYYEWVMSSHGIVENNAIEGGQINNETVYVCRVVYWSSPYLGVMQPSKGYCHVYYDDRYNYQSSYDLLTFK